jgi:hypothetical protein
VCGKALTLCDSFQTSLSAITMLAPFPGTFCLTFTRIFCLGLTPWSFAELDPWPKGCSIAPPLPGGLLLTACSYIFPLLVHFWRSISSPSSHPCATGGFDSTLPLRWACDLGLANQLNFTGTSDELRDGHFTSEIQWHIMRLLPRLSGASHILSCWL